MNEVPSYAIDYPENTAKIVLMGTSWRGWPATDDENRIEIMEAGKKKIDLSYPANALKCWQQLGTDTSSLASGLINKYISAHQATDPAAGLFGGAVRKPSGCRVQSTEDSPHFDASSILVPTLILRGENDPIANLEDNKELLEALGAEEKRLVTISGAGHFIQFERSNGESLGAMLEFLEN